MANMQGTMTVEQELAALRAERDKLKAENDALNASKARGISFKVSAKGGVSVYGLGRYPVSLYKSQWDNFLDPANIEALKTFIKHHESQLKAKPAKEDIESETTGQIKTA